MTAKKWRDARDGYLMLLPTLLGVIIFFAFPLAYSLYLSLTNSRLLARVGDPTRFIGLDNYVKAIQNSVFRESLGTTLFLSVMVLIFSIVPALFIAVLINEKIRGQSFFRSIYFIPVVASVVGITLVWRFLLNKDFGWVNLAIEWFGKSTGLDKSIGLVPVSWLGNAKFALTAVILVVVWKTIGYNIVILLAGMQGINKQLYEAANIDGANRWETFFNVTLPMLSPTSFFVLVTTLIACLQIFDVPYALGWTRGNQAGPADSMLTNVVHLYREAFINNSTGYASALAWILTIIILIITAVQFRISKRWVNYE